MEVGPNKLTCECLGHDVDICRHKYSYQLKTIHESSQGERDGDRCHPDTTLATSTRIQESFCSLGSAPGFTPKWASSSIDKITHAIFTIYCKTAAGMVGPSVTFIHCTSMDTGRVISLEGKCHVVLILLIEVAFLNYHGPFLGNYTL